jgi:hypothetical protein
MGAAGRFTIGRGCDDVARNRGAASFSFAAIKNARGSLGETARDAVV